MEDASPLQEKLVLSIHNYNLSGILKNRNQNEKKH